MGWMTASECADWWRDLLNQGTDALYAKMEKNGLGADTEIGFQITWRVNVLSSVVDMFVFDPLRLGAGTGMAVGDTRPGFRNGAVRVLNVVADIGRATVFLPFGKLTRLGRVGAVEDRAIVQGTREAVSSAPAARNAGAPGNAGMPAHGEPLNIQPSNDGLQQASDVLERMFQVAPDAAPGHCICGWDMLTRALRDTKRWYIRIEDVARMMGVDTMPFSRRTAEALSKLNMKSVSDFNTVLSKLGIAAREVPITPLKAMAKMTTAASKAMGKATDEVAQTLKLALSMQSKKGVMVFLVEWTQPNGKWAGHVMYAKVDDAGRLLIVDRSGIEIRALADLEHIQPGISGAKLWEYVRPDGTKGGLLYIEDAVLAESSQAMSKALQQVKNNPMFNMAHNGLFGPVSIPVKLQLHIPATPNIPRPPVH